MLKNSLQEYFYPDIIDSIMEYCQGVTMYNISLHSSYSAYVSDNKGLWSCGTTKWRSPEISNMTLIVGDYAIKKRKIYDVVLHIKEQHPTRHLINWRVDRKIISTYAIKNFTDTPWKPTIDTGIIRNRTHRRSVKNPNFLFPLHGNYYVGTKRTYPALSASYMLPVGHRTEYVMELNDNLVKIPYPAGWTLKIPEYNDHHCILKSDTAEALWSPVRGILQIFSKAILTASHVWYKKDKLWVSQAL